MRIDDYTGHPYRFGPRVAAPNGDRTRVGTAYATTDNENDPRKRLLREKAAREAAARSASSYRAAQRKRSGSSVDILV